jgi:predicted RND superfamily exporter protein
MVGFLFPLAVIVIALVHYEAFRTVQAMVLPLCTALLSVVLALSLMGMLGLPMDTWSALTPVLILAIAAGHAVQILKRYYEEYARVRDTDEAVVRALTAVGPVMLTAGTIASAGFASLASFGVTSVRVFGLLLASGILSALLIEMTFVPACRSLLPPPRMRELSREREKRWIDRLLDRLANGVTQRPLPMLAILFGAVAAIGLGMGFIAVDNSFRLWFAASTRIRTDDLVLNEKLPGTATLRVLIEGDRPGVIKEPTVLRAIRDFETYIAADEELGGVTSIVDQVERIHQAMHGGNGDAYDVPDSQKLVDQYLFLYEMSAGPDGLTSFVDPDYRYAVVRALSKTDRAAFSRELLARLDSFADKRFRDLPVRVEIAGGTLGVQTALNDEVVQEKIANVIQVSVIILVLCAIVLRSLVGGLFVLVPLACAVIVNLGLMGWLGIWLDMTTAAITAMGVSIGADFAIYLIFRIREQRRAGAERVYAVREALQTSGKAIFFVSSAVVAGYLVLPFSGFSVWVRLGCLTALIVGVSALATLTVIPALALLLRPKFLDR